jgi:hypothetical protein
VAAESERQLKRPISVLNEPIKLRSNKYLTNNRKRTNKQQTNNKQKNQQLTKIVV